MWQPLSHFHLFRNESVVIDFRESAPDGSGTVGSDREYSQNPLSATTVSL